MYKFLKDSDGLDRVRLKKYLPKDIIDKFLGEVIDPNYLRIASSKNLIDLSYKLCYKEILLKKKPVLNWLYSSSLIL